MELPARDLAAALDVVADVAAAQTLDDYFDVCLTRLGELVPGNDVSFNAWRWDGGRARVVGHRGRTYAKPQALRDLLEIAPTCSWLRLRPDHRTGGTVSTTDDFLSRAEVHAHEAYHAFYRPLEIEHQLGWTLPAPPGQLRGILVDRDSRGFTEAEVALARAVAPHLAAIYRNVAARERLERRVRDLEAALRAGTLDAPRPEAAGELTAREAEVVELVARGLTNPQIAAALYISRRTVQRHLENVYAKLGVRTRAAAAARWLELRRAA